MDIFEKIYNEIRNQFRKLPANVPAALSSINKTVSKVELPSLTVDNVLYYYLPLQGLVSYTTLSVGVMNPHLMVRLFPRRDVTDVLFMAAGTGAGLWLWARPHMAAAAPARRFSWALLGGCLWPLGSIFLWAILRSSVGQRPIIGTILGVSTGAVLTNIAIDYFQYIELMCRGEIHVPDEVYTTIVAEDDI